MGVPSILFLGGVTNNLIPTQLKISKHRPALQLVQGAAAPAPDAAWNRRQFSAIWAPLPYVVLMCLFVCLFVLFT